MAALSRATGGSVKAETVRDICAELGVEKEEDLPTALCMPEADRLKPFPRRRLLEHFKLRGGAPPPPGAYMRVRGVCVCVRVCLVCVHARFSYFVRDSKLQSMTFANIILCVGGCCAHGV